MKHTRKLFVAASLAALSAPTYAGSIWRLPQVPVQTPQDPAPAPVPTIEEAQAKLNAGDFTAAEVAFGAISAADPTNGQAVFLHAYCLHMLGKIDEAHQRHIDATAFPQFAALGHYNHACVHALKNEKDIAFTVIGEAREAGFNNLSQLETDTDMDNLRSDPRFAQLLRALGGGTDPADLASLPAERLLDFTLGDWTSFSGEEEVGTTSSKSAFEGIGVVTSSTGVTGETRSTATYIYVAERQVWKQVWVGRDGTHAVLEGGLKDGKLVLTMTEINGEAKVEGRSVYSNIAADSFQLSWQTTTDAGANWSEDAVLTYKRK